MELMILFGSFGVALVIGVMWMIITLPAMLLQAWINKRFTK